jgi:DNA-binding CsgD family transcriptional regulator
MQTGTLISYSVRARCPPRITLAGRRRLDRGRRPASTAPRLAGGRLQTLCRRREAPPPDVGEKRADQAERHENHSRDHLASWLVQVRDRQPAEGPQPRRTGNARPADHLGRRPPDQEAADDESDDPASTEEKRIPRGIESDENEQRAEDSADEPQDTSEAKAAHRALSLLTPSPGRIPLSSPLNQEPEETTVLSLRASRTRSPKVIMLSSDLARVPTEAAAAQQNLRVAERSGDVRTQVDALNAMHIVLAGPLNVAQRLEIADRAERLCLDADLEDDLAWPLGCRVDAYFQLGQRPALDNAIARLEEYADRRNDALATWRAKMARAALAQHEGRFDDAIRLGTEAVRLAARGNHQAADFAYQILIYLCRVKTGGQPMDDLIPGRRGGPDVVRVFWAMVTAEAGDLETAAALFPSALPMMDELDGSDLQVGTYIAFAIVAWTLEHAQAAPAIYAGLAPFADELGVTSSGQGPSMGSVSRYLGQMAALNGDWDRVEADFARAMRRNLETGARGEVAETRFDWARALLRRGHARDRERASAMLDAAERGATELGMEPLRRRAAEARAALKAGRSRLTNRELEIAALVAQGLTNKEVAARLRISVRTSENHLLNVMNKLGLENRAQVAAWFARTGSTGEGPTI